MAISTAIPLPNPTATGIPKEMDQRYPHDLEAARKLLGGAGYRNGLQPVFHSRNDRGDGDSNWGNYRDDKLDSVIDRARVETDRAKRQALINEAMKMIHENVYYIPLHRRIAPWASRANVDAVHRANNHLMAIWVVVEERAGKRDGAR